MDSLQPQDESQAVGLGETFDEAFQDARRRLDSGDFIGVRLVSTEWWGGDIPGGGPYGIPQGGASYVVTVQLLQRG